MHAIRVTADKHNLSSVLCGIFVCRTEDIDPGPEDATHADVNHRETYYGRRRDGDATVGGVNRAFRLCKTG